MELKEMADKVDQINTLLPSLKKELEGKIDVLQKEKIDKISDVISKNAEELQALKIKSEEQEKYQKSLEKLLSQKDYGTKNVDEMVSRVAKEYNLYLASGRSEKISSEVKEFVVSSMLEDCKNSTKI